MPSLGFVFDVTESEMIVAKSINSGEDWELINLDITIQTRWDDEKKIVLNSQDNQKLLVNSLDGVFNSRNGGMDWQSSNKGLKAIGGKIFVAQDNTDVIFLTHNKRKNYKTIDGGESWEKLAAPNIFGSGSHTECYKTIFNPKNNQEILCLLYSGETFRSIDGGKNWLFSLDHSILLPESTQGGIRRISNLHYLPDSKKIYASYGNKFFIKNVEDNNEQNISIMEWTQANTHTYISSIVVDPRNSQVIFMVGVDNYSTSVYKSEDGGGTWQKKIGAIHDRGHLLIHPIFPDRLVFIDGPTISISDNGGNSWGKILYNTDTIGEIFSIIFNPRNKDGFFIQTENGTFETKDLGQHVKQVGQLLPPFRHFNIELLSYGDGVYFTTSTEVHKLTSLAISNETKNCVFNWAEQQYPALFGLTIGESSQNEQYTYRYYSDTQTYLGFFQDEKVHYLNASQSDNIEDVGFVEYYQHLSGCD
ncbi:MAG: hypothetical protein L3J59_15825 [Methylococcaceae bacterium]|nr:hypothetical protein [Methylococcaceae bacterium]